MRKDLCKLLADSNIRPVLMDVGASGAPLPIWNDIAPQSIYIGFDPDLREIHEDNSSEFHRSVMVNEAVIADSANEVSFYLTKFPYCSTTLAPNPQATSHWLERDNFDVEAHAVVRATTINSILRRLDIPRIDWIKLDTQGIDLRLLKSIAPDVLTRVMAVDTEPGLIDIYQGEDMFVDVHRDLTSSGFWLSRIMPGGFVRMRRTTLDAMSRVDRAVDERYLRRCIRTSPAYIEARYLRTLEWLAERSLSPQEYVLLWVFALTDDQFGFALDISAEFKRIFGETESSRTLNAATAQSMKHAARRASVNRAVLPLVQRLASILNLLRG